MKICIFGTGNIGGKIYNLLKAGGVIPAFFFDNNLKNKFYDGIPVVKPTNCGNEIDYYLLCSDQHRSMKSQLINMGVEENKIKIVLNNCDGYFQIKKLFPEFCCWKKNENSKNNTVLMDLANGLVLGGVESWALEKGVILKKRNYNVVYIDTSDKCNNIINDDVMSKNLDLLKVDNNIISIGNAMLKYAPCNIICNFASLYTNAAFVLKMEFPNLFNIITVIHGDEKAYYKLYSDNIQYISYVIYISNRMLENALMYNISKDKLKYMGWKINCPVSLNRKYLNENGKIRIGYAGRVVKYQKRVDLLLEVACKLVELDVKFIISIAGDGEDFEAIKNDIEKNNLHHYFNLLGRIDRNDIPAFWREQDIVLGCSESEGRSISKAEAMAEGCVPIVTNTSGASDDVIHGVNGYIVPIGDVEQMVNYISYLYNNKEVLEKMGIDCHQKIKVNNNNFDEELFWNQIIKNYD